MGLITAHHRNILHIYDDTQLLRRQTHTHMHTRSITKKRTKDLCLPPNMSCPAVLEEKLSPSGDTTGAGAASTTSLLRKGLRFGMASSTASEEEKGSEQARRERIEDIRECIRD